MQVHRNATCAREAPVDGLIRTRYTLVVCVVCGHERIHTPRHETSCPAMRRQRPPLVHSVPRPEGGRDDRGSARAQATPDPGRA